jgi:hypothetical protein
MSSTIDEEGDFLLTSFCLKLGTMKKTLLLIALATLVTTINVDAQSKGSQLNSGGKARTSSSVGKRTTSKPSNSNVNSNHNSHKAKPKARVNSSTTSSKPARNYRKDEDYTHNNNSSTESTSTTNVNPAPPVVDYTNGVFTVGPNFQQTTDYSYMCRYRNTVFARSFNTRNCVFPRVRTLNSRNNFLNVNPMLMALTNTTADTMFVDVSFFGKQASYSWQLQSWTTNTFAASVVLAPGETKYVYQYRQFYKMNVYTKSKSEENLINEYSGNCSRTNIYLSLSGDLPK